MALPCCSLGLGRGGRGAEPGMLPVPLPGMLPAPLPLPAAFPGALEGTVGFGPPRPPPPRGCRAPSPAQDGSGGFGSSGNRHRPFPCRARHQPPPGPPARDGAASFTSPIPGGGSHWPYRNLKHAPTAQPFPCPLCLLHHKKKTNTKNSAPCG